MQPGVYTIEESSREYFLEEIGVTSLRPWRPFRVKLHLIDEPLTVYFSRYQSSTSTIDGSLATGEAVTINLISMTILIS